MGSTGEVFLGEVPTENPELSGYFGTIMEWSDKYRKLGVRTNADTPHGRPGCPRFWCRRYWSLPHRAHVLPGRPYFCCSSDDRFRNTRTEKSRPSQDLPPMQKNDFKELFQIMKGHPVKIRLLDPPLHEFLPKTKEDIAALAKEMEISAEKLTEKVEYLHEFNPMMGHRGCRLGVTFPEIFEMQVEAIAEAACELIKEGESIVPEIMIPLSWRIQ